MAREMEGEEGEIVERIVISKSLVNWCGGGGGFVSIRKRFSKIISMALNDSRTDGISGITGHSSQLERRHELIVSCRHYRGRE